MLRQVILLVWQDTNELNITIYPDYTNSDKYVKTSSLNWRFPRCSGRLSNSRGSEKEITIVKQPKECPLEVPGSGLDNSDTRCGLNTPRAIREAEMKSSFWEYFIENGRKNLLQYNRKQGTTAKVFRCHTIEVNDLESFSIYLRKKMCNCCIDHSLTTLDITKFKSTDLAIKLGWSYIGWHGTPIKNMLTTNELRNFEVNSCPHRSKTNNVYFKVNKDATAH
ncbi:hypothetical protein COOONC_02883 [Cooperia oncophora]